MEIRVGCTGWGYSAWKGTFYPKNLEERNWLKHYSSIFNVTEVNSSFYRPISTFMARKWNIETPDDFWFSLKFPKTITHDNRLDPEKSQKDLMNFFTGLYPLKKKIAVLLLQLPPSLKFDEAKPRLEKLSKSFPHYCRYAVEGRHESWFEKETLDYLADRKYCLVWGEVPMVDNHAFITTDFIYVRLIGDRALPDDVYDHTVRDQSNVIQKWTDKIECKG